MGGATGADSAAGVSSGDMAAGGAGGLDAGSPESGAGGFAMIDGRSMSDGSAAAADGGVSADASPPDSGGGQWLVHNMPSSLLAPGCTCTPSGWSCAPVAQWEASLAQLCAGVAEAGACAGEVKAVMGIRAFVVGGLCRAGRCCPGCWDGKQCRVRFENSGSPTIIRTVHKVRDYVTYGPGLHDWTYFCGSGGEVCTSAKGDAEGSRACKLSPSLPFPSDTCPDKILP
jgi:hypothetical protein